MAVAAVALVAGGATASGVFQAQGHEGAFNPGQPLHCKGVANMTPREAATWLSDHGYDVTWQVEDKTPGVPKGQQTSYQTKDAPSQGSIAGAVVIQGHEMIVVVETGPEAIRADDCPEWTEADHARAGRRSRGLTLASPLASRPLRARGPLTLARESPPLP